MSWLEDIGKVIPMAELHGHRPQSTMPEVAGTLGDAINVSRFAVRPMNNLLAQPQRWKRYLDRLAEKVPQERRVEADPQLAGTVFNGLQCVGERGIIAELFLNLLARAIDRERISEAHPAFAYLISHLSHDEALILFYLNERTFNHWQYAPYYHKSGSLGPRTTTHTEFPTQSLLFPQNFPLYMDHLHGLQLAAICQQGKEEPVMQGMPLYQTGVNIKSIITLQSIGRVFAQACLPDKLNQEWIHGDQ